MFPFQLLLFSATFYTYLANIVFSATWPLSYLLADYLEIRINFNLSTLICLVQMSTATRCSGYIHNDTA